METASAIRAQLGLRNGEGPRDGTGYAKTNGEQKQDRNNKEIGGNPIRLRNGMGKQGA
jgi:hypothetical protein